MKIISLIHQPLNRLYAMPKIEVFLAIGLVFFLNHYSLSNSMASGLGCTRSNALDKLITFPHLFVEVQFVSGGVDAGGGHLTVVLCRKVA